jgi:hypothetical protein
MSMMENEEGLTMVASQRKRKTIPLETQLDQLDQAPVGGNPDAFKQPFKLANDHAARFREFYALSRRLNYAFPDLEIVFLGAKGSGKSSLIEAIVGEPCNLIDSTRRCMYFHMINDPTATTTKYYVRDSQGEASPTTVDELRQVLTARNKRTAEPLFVHLEAAWGFNMTLIDTPPLRSLEDIDFWARPSGILDTHHVAASGQPHNRILVCVEPAPTALTNTSARPTDQLTLLPMIKKFDPQLNRTLFVLSSFDGFLEAFETTPSVIESSMHNEHIVNGEKITPYYWVSLPSQEVRAACSGNVELYQKRLWQYFQLDNQELKFLDVDSLQSAIASSLGPYTVRQYLIGRYERHVSLLIPELSRAFNDNVTTISRRLKNLRELLDNWNVDKIRSYASTYTTRYLKFVESIIGGSIIGNPSQHGQTLADEERYLGRSWEILDSELDLPMTTPRRVQNEKVPGANIKLYGAPQLFRMLEDFRLAAMKLAMPPVQDTELSIASFDPAWTASEIARTKIQQQFFPLLQQLLERAYAIMKRVVTVCDSFVDERITTGAGVSNPTHRNSVLRRVLPSTVSVKMANTAIAAAIAPYARLKERRESRAEGLVPPGSPGGATAAASAAASKPDADILTTSEDLDIRAVESAAAGTSAVASFISQREFPAFAAFLKQSYFFALTSLQTRCQAKCQDEFYAAQTLYWELTGLVDPLATVGQGPKVKQDNIRGLVKVLYAEIKSRLIDAFTKHIQTYFASSVSIMELVKSVVAVRWSFVTETSFDC